MTGRPINLRQARKRRDRDRARAEADARAAEHGVPKTARTAAETERDRAVRRLDAHRLDRDDEDPASPDDGD